MGVLQLVIASQTVTTAAQMTELTNAVHALIIAIVTGATLLIGAYLYQWRVSLPRQFKLRDEKRATENEALKQELKNKADAEAVDIERDRMLPKVIESTIQMAQSINTTMMQNVQQTATYIAQLSAHDRTLTANTDRLETLAETVDQAITNIQLLKSQVDANTDHSKTAALFGERAAQAAEETLELVRSELSKIVRPKGDTKPIPPLADTAEPGNNSTSAAA